MKCHKTDICFTCEDNRSDHCERGKEEYPTGCAMFCREPGSDDHLGVKSYVSRIDIIGQNGNDGSHY